MGLRTKEEQGMVETEWKRLRIVFVSLKNKKPMKGVAEKQRPTRCFNRKQHLTILVVTKLKLILTQNIKIKSLFFL